MAKIEPWEQRLRESMEQFADQVNSAWPLVFHTHANARAQDPENVPEIDTENDPKWMDKLVKPARQLLNVWGSIAGAIHTEEDGDIKAFRRAVQPVSEFYNGCRVKLGVSWQGDEIRVDRDFLEEESEKPFVAFVLADWFFEYITRYKEIVHLGVCRLCSKVYLKPKHGQKSRYCSSSCKQKAYRQRKKESEA